MVQCVCMKGLGVAGCENECVGWRLAGGWLLAATEAAGFLREERMHDA